MMKKLLLFACAATTVFAQGRGGPANREAPVTPVPFERILRSNQEPQNWGPPSLSFAGGSGFSGLNDGNYSVIHNQTGWLYYQMYWNRGRNNVQYGGDFKRHAI